MGKTTWLDIVVHSLQVKDDKPDVLAKRTRAQYFFDSANFVYYIVAAFSVYVAGMLKITDHILARTIVGYEFSGNYIIGMGIFFLAAVSYLHLARWRRWLNWRYYVLGSVVIFFPLVFLASSVKLLFNPDSALIFSLNARYCSLDIGASLCGEAFAALVSSMSLRALPVVLTVPAMFWFFIIRPEYFDRSPL